jgi:hypothetical protein
MAKKRFKDLSEDEKSALIEKAANEMESDWKKSELIEALLEEWTAGEGEGMDSWIEEE